MKLYEECIRYKTCEMIGMMLNVSNQKIRSYKEINNQQNSYFIECCMTSFSFGRRSGHTSGAIEYIKNNKHAYLVVHSEYRKTDIIRSQHLSQDVIGRIISLSARKEVIFSLFAGIKDIELIFDAVMEEDNIYKFVNNSTFLHNVSALCKIG